jgi:hypothetical protein
LAAAQECTPLLAGEPLAAGAITRVTITLAMHHDADNSGQAATAETTLSATLADPEASDPDRGCTPGGGIPLVPSPDKPAAGPTERPSGGAVRGRIRKPARR